MCYGEPSVINYHLKGKPSNVLIMSRPFYFITPMSNLNLFDFYHIKKLNNFLINFMLKNIYKLLVIFRKKKMDCFMTWPHLTSPDLSWPLLTSTGLTWPCLTSPNFAWCHLILNDLPDIVWSRLTLFDLGGLCLILSEFSWPLMTFPDLFWPLLICSDLTWPCFTSPDLVWPYLLFLPSRVLVWP